MLAGAEPAAVGVALLGVTPWGAGLDRLPIAAPHGSRRRRQPACEVPSGRIVAGGLSMPHSPRVVDGQLYVLGGGRGQLLRIDPSSGDRELVAKLPGFTRRLAGYHGVLIVGLSKLRDNRGPQGLPIESENAELVAGVAAVNARRGRVLGILELITGVEEIFDLHALPPPWPRINGSNSPPSSP